MHAKRKLRLLLLAALIACSASARARADQIDGKVVAVADGDTLTVLDAGRRQHRIRLLGIDAPESGQDFGARSKQHLSGLVFGREVSVEYEKKDRYERTLGKVLVAGRDANLEMVGAGLAWHYKYYQGDQSPEDRRLYAGAEVEARAARRGLWVDASPTPPWDFRRGRRSSQSTGEGAAPARGSPPGWEGAGRGVESDDQAQTVYVTRTGEKYHRAGCQYLRRSRMPISLKEAKRRHSACSVCKPPP